MRVVDGVGTDRQPPGRRLVEVDHGAPVDLQVGGMLGVLLQERDDLRFGVGPHVCVGASMAMLQLIVAVAVLAQRFRFRLRFVFKYLLLQSQVY